MGHGVYLKSNLMQGFILTAIPAAQTYTVILDLT